MSAEFSVTVGLYQESAVSPFLLFVVVLAMLVKSVRKQILWELLYAYDLGILADMEEELHRRVVQMDERVREEWTRVDTER